MSETTPKKKDAEKPHPMGDPRYKGIDRVLKRQQYQQDALIEVLTAAQEAFGYLTEESMIYTARQLKLPFSWVYGVATFYHFFSLKPQGEHSCIVCLGTACYVGKAADIIASVEQAYNVKAGSTTDDGKLTLIATRCLGCCGLAPVVVLDQVVHGKETPEGALAKVGEVVAGGNGGQREPAILRITTREVVNVWLGVHGSTSNGTEDANGEQRLQAGLNPLETLEIEEKTAL